VLPATGVIEEMFRPDVTVKLTPLLAKLATDTTMFPVVAPVGAEATICESLQTVAVAVVPLNFTVLKPCVPPKPAPRIVTDAPIPPFVGETLVIPGPAVTEKVCPLLGPFAMLTTTGPVVTPGGTGALIWLLPHVVGVAGTPLNVT
jgi:hypothetical protein